MSFVSHGRFGRWIAGLFAVVFLSGAALAADPLFVNLTSDDGHRAHMAIAFSQATLEAGHPVTLFLNVDAVKIAATKARKQQHNRDMLAKFMKSGGKVLACPHCVEHAKLKAADLIEGVQIGTPEMTQEALFAPGARTLSW